MAPSANAAPRYWDIQAIDTMKYSRDLARDTEAQRNIPEWVAKVADLGPTHIAIGTPYDEEFVPVLTTWVEEARKHKLKVWYRGNFSAWEGWFDRPKRMSPEEHYRATTDFITKHPELFEAGDIFTPAPEPENGAMGDPRQAKSQHAPFLAFLTQSQTTCEQAFLQIRKGVICGYFSTNGDVAKEVLTKESVRKSGGVVVIDHYVKDPKQLFDDILFLHKKYEAPIAVGEFGAPIPDLHGELDETDQAKRVREDLSQLARAKDRVIAINYWTAFDGTTQLFNSDGSAREAVNAIKDFYKPGMVSGRVMDKNGQPVIGANVATEDGFYTAKTNDIGEYELVLPQEGHKLVIEAEHYKPVNKSVSIYRGDTIFIETVMSRNDGFFAKIRLFFSNIITWLRV